MTSVWDTEEIFHDGDSLFTRLIQLLDEARESIDFETYIFYLDHLGTKVLKALSRASCRGVRVRLLVDGVGSYRWSHETLRAIRDRGVDARIYHPLPWQSRHFSWLGLARFSEVGYRLFQLNRRDHRKTVVIDGKSAFVTGMNVSANHLRSVHGTRAWKDAGVFVRGENVRLFSSAFEHAWDSGSVRLLPEPLHNLSQHSPVRLNVNRDMRRRFGRNLVKRINRSRERIWIATPYLVPTPGILWALSQAARRKVDVRVLTPAKNDVFFMRWAAHAFFAVLQAAGVKVYEYLPTVLHSKVWLIDDYAIVGSSNLNSRSLFHDLEADVVLCHPTSIASFNAVFLEDLRSSVQISAGDWARRPRIERFLEWLALRARHWI